MSDEASESGKEINDLGVHIVEGSFNLHSGKLDELCIEVFDSDATNNTRWKIVYDVSVGKAEVQILPEITKPGKLAQILARSDAAIRKVEPVDEVRRWHEVYGNMYGSVDLEEIEKEFQNMSHAVEDDPESLPFDQDDLPFDQDE